MDILSEEWQDADVTIQEEGEIRSALNRMDVEAPDTEMAWKALSEQLNLEEEKPAPARRVSISLVAKSLISMAAAVLLAFLLVKGLGKGNVADVSPAASPSAPSASLVSDKVDASADNAPIYNKVDDAVSASATSDGQDLLSTETGRGNCKQLVLSDGTKVWLNAESSLLYPKHFAKNERRVHLSGEAYFEVKHNKKCPFIVETASLVATDLGTAFDVKAYAGKLTQLILVSGKVSVCKRGDEASSVMMKPDDMATLEGGSIKVTEVDTYPLIQWKNGLFYFHHASLLEVMKEIGRWYHVNVVFENKASLNTQVHFVAERKASIDDIVRLLNDIEGVNIVKTNNEMIVR